MMKEHLSGASVSTVLGRAGGRAKRRLRAWTSMFTCGLLVALVGCGQKGPLTLKPKGHAKTATPVESPSTPRSASSAATESGAASTQVPSAEASSQSVPGVKPASHAASAP